MEIIKLSCPQCGASLEVDNGLDTFFCMYCGARVILNDQSDEIIKAKARIVEQENELEFKRHKLKHDAEEKERAFQRRLIRQEKYGNYKVKKEVVRHFGLASLIKAMAIFMIVALVFYFVVDAAEKIPQMRQDKKNEQLENEIVMLIEDGQYDEAIDKVSNINGGSYDRNWTEKKHYLKRKANKAKFQDKVQTEVALDMSSKDFEQMTEVDTISFLENIGFFDIESVEVGENGLFTPSRIKSISINGESSFKKNTVFPLDARVMITYIA